MTHTPSRLHLVQLAGGKGLRVGGHTPKQFRDTGRGPLFGVSLGEFLKLSGEVGQVVSITVTVADQWAAVVNDTLQMPPGGQTLHLAEPGSTRTESTWHALQVIAAQASPLVDDLVAVHDAARPFATVGLLEELVREAAKSEAAVPGIPVADTILQTAPDKSAGVYLPRKSLVAVQTPQVFRWELLYSSHRWAAENRQVFTDDGSLVAQCGTHPVVIPGEQFNWKVTTEGDWRRAFEMLA